MAQTSENMKMIARVVSKVNTQAMIKALRGAGLTVDRHNDGHYTCIGGSNGTLLLFRAMPGRNGYLIRMREELFV